MIPPITITISSRQGIAWIKTLIFSCKFIGASVAFFLSHKIDHYHTGQTPEDTRDIAGHKQSCHRGSSADQRESDHYVAGRDQKSCRRCGNIGSSGEVWIISFIFFNRIDDRPHGRSCCCTGRQKACLPPHLCGPARRAHGR